MSDYEMLNHLARAQAIYGNGEGLAIAADNGVCYWCQRSEPCGIDHREEIERQIDDRLEVVRARLGLEFNC